jgi:hypothetical protein
VTINSNTVVNFTTSNNPLAAYSISGTVSYSGSHTGITYIRVFDSNCGGCSARAGTTIATAPSSTGTSYTIRGLSSGSYVLSAEIDTAIPSTGATNDSNPEGKTSTVTIGSSNLTGENISINDRTPPLAVTPNAPNVFPSNGVAFVSYNRVYDSNDINNGEIATSYKLYYDTNSSFPNGTFATIPAGDPNNVYVLSGLTNTNYWFKLIAHNANGDSTTTPTVVGPVLIGATSGQNTVSGTVTSAGITAAGPLYVGLFSDTLGVYVQRIASPTSSQAFSISGIPNGDYQIFVVLDQNADGLIDAGDITNFTGENGPPSFTVSGSSSGNTITLTSFTAKAFVTTNTQGSSGGSTTYNISVGVAMGTKRPVSLTLTSGPNVAVPYDMVFEIQGNHFSPVYNNSVIPTVGDTYTFHVTFSDGTTSSPDLTASVTAVLGSSSFAQNLHMVTSPSPLTRTLPQLTWAAPATHPTS